MRLFTLLAILPLLAASAAETRLQDLDLLNIQQGWGKAQAGRSVAEKPLTIGGTAFDHGVGTHAPSVAEIALDGRATRFQAFVGVNDSGRNEPGSVVFTVVGDGRELFRSEMLHGGDQPVRVDVPLAGIETLRLQASDGGDNMNSDHANWAAAVITHEGAPPELVPPGTVRLPPDLYPPAEARKPSPGNTAYHIDPASGDDSRSGRSPAQSWRSLKPLHALLLAPGDRVFLSPGKYAETLMPMGAGTADRPVEIHFAKGEYDFFPAKAKRLALHISNSNDDPHTPKPVAVLLQGVKHFRLQGNGSDLFVHGKMIKILCDHAEDVAVSGLAFDYRRPLVSEFTILGVAEHHADVEIQKDCTYAIENGRFVWIGEGWRSNGTGLNQEVDPADDGRTWRRGGGPLGGVTKAEELAPFRVRLHFNANPGFTKGRIIQFRETFRDMVGGFIVHSRDIAFRDGAFYALGGMGVVHQFSENITYERMRLAPRIGGGRTTCAWADMLHFSGCRGRILVDTVTFSGSHDDPVNVHGTYLRLVDKPAPQQVRVRFMHPQTYGFPAFFAGDTVEFVNHDTLRAYGTNQVVAAEMEGGKDMLLTLRDPVPPTAANDVLENVTWTPSVTIRNCHVSSDSCRGFLLATPRPVVVEGCTFVKTTMSAILIGGEANSWFESGPVRDVVIRGNTFVRCGEPVIHIEPENRSARPGEPVHRNIRIEGNTFQLKGNTAISAKSVQGLRITGNRFSSPTLPIRQHACTEVVIEGNETSVK